MSISTDPKFGEKVQGGVELSRREFVAAAAVAATRRLVRRPTQARSGGVMPPYGNGTIPAGIRSRSDLGRGKWTFSSRTVSSWIIAPKFR